MAPSRSICIFSSINGNSKHPASCAGCFLQEKTPIWEPCACLYSSLLMKMFNRAMKIVANTMQSSARSAFAIGEYPPKRNRMIPERMKVVALIKRLATKAMPGARLREIFCKLRRRSSSGDPGPYSFCDTTRCVINTPHVNNERTSTQNTTNSHLSQLWQY